MSIKRGTAPLLHYHENFQSRFLMPSCWRLRLSVCSTNRKSQFNCSYALPIASHSSFHRAFNQKSLVLYYALGLHQPPLISVDWYINLCKLLPSTAVIIKSLLVVMVMVLVMVHLWVSVSDCGRDLPLHFVLWPTTLVSLPLLW